MGKLIIDNRSGHKDEDALRLCIQVIKEGRISDEGKSYCHLTTFAAKDNDVSVFAKRNKRSDKLTVYDEP